MILKLKMDRRKLKRFRDRFARTRMTHAHGFNINVIHGLRTPGYLHVTRGCDILHTVGPDARECGAVHCVAGWAYMFGYAVESAGFSRDLANAFGLLHVPRSRVARGAGSEAAGRMGRTQSRDGAPQQAHARVYEVRH